MPKKFKIMCYKKGTGGKAREVFVGRGKKKETIKKLEGQGYIVSTPIRAERRSSYDERLSA